MISTCHARRIFLPSFLPSASRVALRAVAMPYVPPHLRRQQAATGDAVVTSESSESSKSLQDLLQAPSRPPQEQPRFREQGARGGAAPFGSRARGPATYLSDLPHGVPLLGGSNEFCDSFFHVRATPEAGLPLRCLRLHGECEGRQTVIVARLQERASPTAGQWFDRFVGRFANRGKDHHAERVMMEDPRLSAALEASPGEACERRLSVYISVQPCHHSSSNARISCTQGLLEWEARTLRPAATPMEVSIAYVLTLIAYVPP